MAPPQPLDTSLTICQLDNYWTYLCDRTSESRCGSCSGTAGSPCSRRSRSGSASGVNSTFFSLVNAAVLRGLPIDAAGDVMFLTLRDARNVPRGLTLAQYQRTFDAGHAC